MNRHDELVAFLEKSIECDPWMRGTGMEGYCREAAKECQEIIEALEKDDIENLKEEIGDVLRVLMVAGILAEERGLFRLDDVYASVLEKVKRRQPFVLQDRKVTRDEAVRIWQEVKAIERKAKEDKKAKEGGKLAEYNRGKKVQDGQL